MKKLYLLLFILTLQFNLYSQYNELSNDEIKDMKINKVYEWVYSVDKFCNDSLLDDSLLVDYECYLYTYDTLGTLLEKKQLVGNDSIIRRYFSDSLFFLINRKTYSGIIRPITYIPNTYNSWNHSEDDISKICYEYKYGKKIVNKLWKNGESENTVYKYGYYLKSYNGAILFYRTEQFNDKLFEIYDDLDSLSNINGNLLESVVTTVNNEMKEWEIKEWVIFDYVFYP